MVELYANRRLRLNLCKFILNSIFLKFHWLFDIGHSLATFKSDYFKAIIMRFTRTRSKKQKENSKGASLRWNFGRASQPRSGVAHRNASAVHWTTSIYHAGGRASLRAGHGSRSLTPAIYFTGREFRVVRTGLSRQISSWNLSSRTNVSIGTPKSMNKSVACMWYPRTSVHKKEKKERKKE